MPTGSGKTRVALEYARERLKDCSVAYLVESNNLAHQVKREAEKIGVKAVPILGAKNPRASEERDLLLQDYDVGEHIGVFSYQGYFLGRGVNQAQLLIVDDAHALAASGVSFSVVEVNREQFPSAHTKIKDLLKANHPILAPQFDRCTVPVHRGGPIVLVPPLGPELASEISAILEPFRKGGGYERYLLNQRLLASPNFTSFPCVVSEASIAWQPFLLPFESFGQGPSGKGAEAEILLLTATKGTDGFLQHRLGLSQKVEFPEMPDIKEMGSRLVLNYPGLSSATPPSQAQGAIINELVHKFGSVLVTATSGEAEPLLRKHLDDDVRVHNYATDESLAPFLAMGEPRVLLVVNRPSGIDIPSKDCPVAVHLGLPYSTSGHEAAANDLGGLGTALEASLAIRLTQLLGRLNRGAKDRSVHFLLTDKVNLAPGSVFVRSLEPAVLLDLLNGERGLCRRYNIIEPPKRAALFDQVAKFIAGDNAVREESLEQAVRYRERLSKPLVPVYAPGKGDVMVANHQFSLGNLHPAFKQFQKFAREAAAKQDGDSAAFYAYQSLCCASGLSMAEASLFGVGGRRGFIEWALEQKPMNSYVVGALTQMLAQGSKQTQIGSELDLGRLRQQSYMYYAKFVARDEESLPAAETRADAATWTPYWQGRLGHADHDALREAISDAFQLLGSSTPHVEDHGNDLVVHWSFGDTERRIAIEVKGRLDEAGKDETEVKVADVIQASTNLQEIDADKGILMTSKSRVHKDLPAEARNRGLAVVVYEGMIQFAAAVAAQCAALERIQRHAGDLTDVPTTVAALGGILGVDGLVPPAAIQRLVKA